MHDCEFGRLVSSNHSAKVDSATHGTKNIIANRLMAVSERSSLAGAFKRVLIHDIERWKVGGSNPSVQMVPS